MNCTISESERDAIWAALRAFQHDRLFYEMALTTTDKTTLDALLARWQAQGGQVA